MRMVNETFQYAGETLSARYLAQIPHHSEILVAASFHKLNRVADYEKSSQRSNMKNLLSATSTTPLTLSSSSSSLSSLANYSSSSSSHPPHIVHDSVMDDVLKSTHAAFSDNTNNSHTVIGKTDRKAGSDAGSNSESLVSSSVNKQTASDSPEF